MAEAKRRRRLLRTGVALAILIGGSGLAIAHQVINATDRTQRSPMTRHWPASMRWSVPIIASICPNSTMRRMPHIGRHRARTLRRRM
jgi:hypothetical protein